LSALCSFLLTPHCDNTVPTINTSVTTQVEELGAELDSLQLEENYVTYTILVTPL
jgi:hypothetical protein